MSFDHILNKLAEKHILAGNKDFAYRLVEASEKECSHCGDKSSEMMKRKSKHFCPKCSKQTKCALKGCEAKMMYAEMHKQGGKAYCCKDCAKADKMKKTALDDMIEKYAKKSFTLKEAREILTPLGVVITAQDGEYRVNFKGGKEDTAYYTDDISDAVGTGKMMKKSSTDDGKKTFAQKDLYIGDRGYEGEGEDLEQEHGFLGQYFWGYGDTKNPYGYNTLEGVPWDEGYEAGFSDASVSMR
jgi:hypothetical protein